MDSSQQDIEALRHVIRSLADRVARLERAAGVAAETSAPEPHGIETSVPPSAPRISAPPTLQPTAVPLTLNQPLQSASQLTPSTPSITQSRSSSQPPLDLESRIGSHWLNRVGITAVLVGVSYFLKFAFDNNWIGPTGRVSIGLLAGIAVVVWSESFRKKGYAVFSYSLKAVGIGILYLSLWAAFHVYALLPSEAVFGAMLLVTAATAAMALSQNAEILAAFALVGGFATPILLSTGVDREFALFSYVAILDFATLLMLIVRPWRRLVLLSYTGTVLLYVGWYARYYRAPELQTTLSFTTLFFLIFAVIPLYGKQPDENKAKFHFVLFSLAFVNAGVYFVEVYGILPYVHQTDAAWFAVALAGLYILLSRQAGARTNDPAVSQKLHLLHLALAAAFITIAIPIRLDQHWITIGWFVEAAILLYVAKRIDSEVLNAFALCGIALGVARLLFFDDFYSTQLIFNARMATYAVAIAVLAVLAKFASERQDDAAKLVSGIAIISLNILALVAFTHEITDYYARQFIQPIRGVWGYGDIQRIQANRISRDFAYSALWMLYGAGLMIVGFWRRTAFVRWQALVLIAATIAKVFIYDLSELDRVYRILSFIALGILLLAVSFVYQRDWLKLSNQKPVARGHNLP